MKPPKLYRKVWLEIDLSDEDGEYYEYTEARRALTVDGALFWQVDSFYKSDVEGEDHEWWFDNVIYKNPNDFDHRNCGTYNRATIKKKEITAEAIEYTNGKIDFDSDIPF